MQSTHEMVAKPTDFFVRRTGDMFFNIANVKAGKKDVLDEMAFIFGWTDVERQQYEKELVDEIDNCNNCAITCYIGDMKHERRKCKRCLFTIKKYCPPREA